MSNNIPISESGGYPLLLGSGGNVFVLDWDIKLKRPAQAKGLRLKPFIKYWKETYPQYADDIEEVMWRLKTKGVNLRGIHSADSVLLRNRLGHNGKPLTREEIETVFAPSEPPKSNPWRGIKTTQPPSCCGTPIAEL